MSVSLQLPRARSLPILAYRFLGAGARFLLAVVLAGSPWLFGAWEMWWFWGFTALLMLATLLLGVRLCLRPWVPAPAPLAPALRLLPWWIPFLGYAAVRACQADVYMDAERSFLLFLTPLLLAVLLLAGCTSRQRLALLRLVLLNLFLLGVYGLINHYVCQSRFVLWEPGYPQYVVEQRATGSYYCPDHFAGIMELALALGLGLLLARGRATVAWRLVAAATVAVALVAVVLSKSRGGGIAVAALLLAALGAGFAQWPRALRWYARILVCAAGVLAIVGAAWAGVGAGYARRFATEFRVTADAGVSGAVAAARPSYLPALARKFAETPRGRMYAAAWRAWRTAPWCGIGPGMHQNLWQHFAPSADGDRATNRWPHPSPHTHSDSRWGRPTSGVPRH